MSEQSRRAEAIVAGWTKPEIDLEESSTTAQFRSQIENKRKEGLKHEFSSSFVSGGNLMSNSKPME